MYLAVHGTEDNFVAAYDRRAVDSTSCRESPGGLARDSINTVHAFVAATN